MKNPSSYKSTIAYVIAFLIMLSLPLPGMAQQVDMSSSQVLWKGFKIAGSHTGTINLVSADLTFDKDQLTGGKFTIDLRTIVCTDLNESKAEQLLDQLKSADFFDVAVYPTAKLIITKVEQKQGSTYNITGDMTIKATTQEVMFPATISSTKATATIEIDRTEFGVEYTSSGFLSSLKNSAIYDDFEIQVELIFSK